MDPKTRSHNGPGDGVACGFFCAVAYSPALVSNAKASRKGPDTRSHKGSGEEGYLMVPFVCCCRSPSAPLGAGNQWGRMTTFKHNRTRPLLQIHCGTLCSDHCLASPWRWKPVGENENQRKSNHTRPPFLTHCGTLFGDPAWAPLARDTSAGE